MPASTRASRAGGAGGAGSSAPPPPTSPPPPPRPLGIVGQERHESPPNASLTDATAAVPDLPDEELSDEDKGAAGVHAKRPRVEDLSDG
eukprot:SAG22_NODE_416_length_10804_cov_4.791126_6_plen_88_part_01